TSKLFAALHDLLVSALVMPRLLAQRREGPGCLRVIALDAAFAPAVRVIHRIHGHTTDRGSDAAPTRSPSLAVRLILMVEVAHLPTCRHAINGEFTTLAGRHFDQGEVRFFAEQLRRTAGGAHRLSATAGIQFQVVYHRARWNMANLQRVAGKDI